MIRFGGVLLPIPYTGVYAQGRTLNENPSNINLQMHLDDEQRKVSPAPSATGQG